MGTMTVREYLSFQVRALRSRLGALLARQRLCAQARLRLPMDRTDAEVAAKVRRWGGGGARASHTRWDISLVE